MTTARCSSLSKTPRPCCTPFRARTGQGPAAGVIMDSKGNLFGTAQAGGSHRSGCGGYGCGGDHALGPAPVGEKSRGC